MTMSSRDGTLPAGWAVRVTTDQMIAGEPMMVIYAVAVSSPSEAVSIVREVAKTTADEDAKAVGVLKAETLKAYGIAPGQAAML